MDLDEVFPLFGTSSSSSSNSRRPTSVAGPKKRRSSILKSVVDPMSSDRAVLQDINGRLASDGSEVDKPKKRSRMSKRVSFSAMNQASVDFLRSFRKFCYFPYYRLPTDQGVQG